MSAQTNKKPNIRKLTTIAVMGAIGAILMFVEFPIPFLIPAFVKFDFSELPALLATFVFGPTAGISVCLLKNLLHLFSGQTAGVGELSNFILGSAFVGVAGLIYKNHKTRKFALIACVTGAVAMAVVCIPFNYYLIYPLYVKVLNFPMEAIIASYHEINEKIDSLLPALVICNVPFTLIKGLAVSLITAIIYKPLSPILKGKKS